MGAGNTSLNSNQRRSNGLDGSLNVKWLIVCFLDIFLLDLHFFGVADFLIDCPKLRQKNDS